MMVVQTHTGEKGENHEDKKEKRMVLKIISETDEGPCDKEELNHI